MTCLQELLLRLAIGLEAVRLGDSDGARREIEAVLSHLESHGVRPGVVLENCNYEQKRA